ncbi:T9SS type A sorting domain-containing protein, partial [Flavobacterium sp.]|uniref:T9SS type A sorting domain-containing protein n=1 Tax=Flavobacterium sp. TaxID=239 RepID=UPI00263759B4
ADEPLISKNTSGTPYQDAPLFGATAVANATLTTICNGGSTVLSATLNKAGAPASSIGTASTVTTLTEELTAFCNRRVSYRYQIVYTAAELAATGLVAGPINAMSFNISANGDSASNTLFTVKMGTTALTAFTNFVSNATFTTVFPSATYTHAIGQNVINFSTPYNWDGVSNIVVEVTHNGIDSINNAQTFYSTTAGNTTVFAFNGAAAGTLSNKRFNVIFTGNVSVPINSYSWSDGSIVVGTGNNLSVSPTVNTTYTATLTYSGCSINTNSVAVTVNTTPAPTGAASQSFVGGQTLADIVVTGTSIVWYASASDAASALNPLPNSTVLVDDAIYYATQTVSGCPSTASLAVTVDVALGVNGFDTNAFKFYPNPVNNILNLSYAQEITNLEVFNFMGQQIFVKKVNATTTQIDMSSFANGAYFVKVSAGSEAKTIKIIKN